MVRYVITQTGPEPVSPGEAPRTDIDRAHYVERVIRPVADAILQELGESTGEKGEKQLVIRCDFPDFGRLQAAIEAKGLTPISAESEYVAENLVELPEDKATEVLKLVDALEQDEDVQRVFHNLK